MVHHGSNARNGLDTELETEATDSTFAVRWQSGAATALWDSVATRLYSSGVALACPLQRLTPASIATALARAS
jgi:hypothetical protein